MYAYICSSKNDWHSTVVFAESRGQAKTIAMRTDTLEDVDFVDIRVSRFKKADGQYRGRTEMDWFDSADRLFLVKECGWSCGEEYQNINECHKCPAAEYCDLWQEYKKETEENHE